MERKLKYIDSQPKKDGFTGRLYLPEKDLFPGKALIVAGGGDGSYWGTRFVARLFADNGMTALAVAYWNLPGLSLNFTDIPLEIMELAAHWLKDRGYQRLAMWGISKGAEYALLCGSYFPDLISCVIAVSPSSVITQGFQIPNGRYLLPKLLPKSSWTYRGRELPYVQCPYSPMRAVKETLKTVSFNITSAYEQALTLAREEDQIRVEKIRGPIQLIAAEHDEMWQSMDFSNAILRRLREHDFAYPVEFDHYAYGSHMMIPRFPKFYGVFAVERRHKLENQRDRVDSFRKSLAFLKAW